MGCCIAVQPPACSLLKSKLQHCTLQYSLLGQVRSKLYLALFICSTAHYGLLCLTSQLCIQNYSILNCNISYYVVGRPVVQVLLGFGSPQLRNSLEHNSLQYNVCVAIQVTPELQYSLAIAQKITVYSIMYVQRYRLLLSFSTSQLQPRTLPSTVLCVYSAIGYSVAVLQYFLAMAQNMTVYGIMCVQRFRLLLSCTVVLYFLAIAQNMTVYSIMCVQRYRLLLSCSTPQLQS